MKSTSRYSSEPKSAMMIETHGAMKMPQIWRTQDAKKKFGRLVKNVVDDGPQIVTRHGKVTAVVMSIEEYRTLKRKTGRLI